MKKFGIGFIAIALAIVMLAFANAKTTSSCGNYYWFRVQWYSIEDCNDAQYFLEYPSDNGDGFPNEVFYGSDVFASSQFGCYTGELYCCALGYNWWDIESGGWPSVWRPKPWAYPQCVIYKD